LTAVFLTAVLVADAPERPILVGFVDLAATIRSKGYAEPNSNSSFATLDLPM
jgi:hypothetical protein